MFLGTSEHMGVLHIMCFHYGTHVQYVGLKIMCSRCVSVDLNVSYMCSVLIRYTLKFINVLDQNSK